MRQTNTASCGRRETLQHYPWSSCLGLRSSCLGLRLRLRLRLPRSRLGSAAMRPRSSASRSRFRSRCARATASCHDRGCSVTAGRGAGRGAGGAGGGGGAGGAGAAGAAGADRGAPGCSQRLHTCPTSPSSSGRVQWPQRATFFAPPPRSRLACWLSASPGSADPAARRCRSRSTAEVSRPPRPRPGT